MQLLKVRFYQLRRDLGVWTILIALAVFFILKEIVAEKNQYSWYIAVLSVFALYQHYIQRNDLIFAKTYFKNPKWQIVLNYNLTLLPCTLALFYTNTHIPALLAHCLVSLFPWMSYSMNGPKFLFLGKVIPASQFEWISGLRKNGLLLIILIVLVIALSPVKLFGIAALFILNLTFIGFYNVSEPRIMLNPRNLEVSRFLNDKVNFLIMIVLITNLPFLIVNCIFHPEVILINAAFLLSFLLLAANSVLIKYASYQPGETQSFSGDLLVLVTAVFIPYLIPVALMLYFVNLKKAKNNLLQFIDDDQH
jgi:hypothetical protein